MRNRLWVAIALVLGLLTTVLVNSYIHQEIDKAKRQFMVGRGPVSVLVAVADIPPQSSIAPEMVAMETRPEDAIQPKALTDPEGAIGKITLAPIYQGEQILDSKLATPENANTLSQKTPPGRRAVTIGIDTISGVGGFIHPGDFVDILGIFNLPTPDGKQVIVTVTLLQRVAVLAAGARFSEQGEGANEANTLTLALTPQETELVLFAREQGKLQLSLRPRVDSEILADLKPMSIDALVAAILGPQLAQAPPPPPPTEPEKKAVRQVEIFRGLEREVVSLPE